MNYRHQIQGRYFLVLVFFLNIMVLLPVLFIIKDPTPYERVAVAGMWADMTLNTAGMGAGVFGPSRRSRYPLTIGFRTSCIGGGLVSRGCSEPGSSSSHQPDPWNRYQVQARTSRTSDRASECE